MASSAPLCTPVRIELSTASPEVPRLYRMSARIALPPALDFPRALVIEGESSGRVAFRLPEGATIRGSANLRSDPERPERGSHAELVGLAPAALEAIRSYIEQRNAA